MEIVVVGAGIGGLFTALRLHAEGLRCVVYEQSPQIRELGVGINALPASVKELAALGLLERLDETGVRTRELIYTHRLGPEIMRRDCGLDAGFVFPQFSVHRGRRTMVIAGGVAAKMVVYPIAAGATPGTKLTNWALGGLLGRPGDPPPQAQDWARPADRAEVAAFVKRFRTPLLDIAGLVDATRDRLEFPMCDRDPLPYWTRGRVTLLGDAAHPMYPVGSNGAGQAIMDAVSLGGHLARHADPEAALVAYQDDRLAATSEVVRRNRLGGPEQVIEEVERRAPDGFDRIEDVIAPAELQAIVAGYLRVSGGSQDQVNR